MTFFFYVFGLVILDLLLDFLGIGINVRFYCVFVGGLVGWLFSLI